MRMRDLPAPPLDRLNSTQSGERRLRAYQEIKHALITGRYRPGDDLSVERIAMELAVSRQPVMEAMRILSREGFIEIIPQVGCRVRVHSVEDIGDFFRLFATVEGLSASLAADRWKGGELDRLRKISEEIGAFRAPKFSDRERAEAYRTLNRTFHGLVAEISRAPMVQQLAQSFWDRSDFHLSAASHYPLFSERLEVAHSDHEEILEVLQTRNAAAAGQIMTQHILGFRMRLLETMEMPAPAATSVTS
jgi:DNA-binding GntR family transcriptional regulator